MFDFYCSGLFFLYCVFVGGKVLVLFVFGMLVFIVDDICFIFIGFVLIFLFYFVCGLMLKNVWV